MTENIVGILEQLTPRTTVKGTAYDMLLGGKLISTFRPGNIKVGDNLKVDYVEKNGFLNAMGIEIVPLDPKADKKQTILPSFPTPKSKIGDTTMGMVLKEAARALPTGTKEQIKARAKMLLEIDQELKAEMQ
jgi:hypothetical protein